MPTREPVWRRPYASTRTSLRRAAQAVRREPWLAVGSAAAVVIAIVTIASHGRATPSAPVQSLNGQAAWSGRRTRGPGNLPAPMDPEVESSQAQAAAAPPQAVVTPPPPAAPALTTAPTHGLWPLAGQVTQGYGWAYQPNGGYWYYNTAWEIAASAGTAVRSAFAGVVQTIEPDPTQGLSVAVESGGELVAEYTGLSKAQVAVGQQVSAGTVIGQLGNAPSGSGKPRLRFALRHGSQPVDPSAYLQATAR